MTKFIIILIIILAAFWAAKSSQKEKKSSSYRKETYPVEKSAPYRKETNPAEKSADAQRDYSASYQKKYLLTKNEYAEYKKLKGLAEKYDFIVCPKVRLLDLVQPKDASDKGALWKIQSKHVDFVICDQNLYVKAILEIDDNSHDLPDRKDRDTFVDAILSNVGYKVIRSRSVTEETLSTIAPKKENGQPSPATME